MTRSTHTCKNKLPTCFENKHIKMLLLPLQEMYKNGGFYMSAHVLLILLNELGKEIKCQAC